MDLKVLAFLLFAGVFLPERGMAECDAMKILSCVKPISESPIFVKLTSAANGGQPTMTEAEFNALCPMMKTAVMCAKDQTKECSPEMYNEMKSSFDQMDIAYKATCNEAIKCRVQMAECFKNYPVFATMDTNSAPDMSLCGPAREVHRCLMAKPRGCQAVGDVRNATQGMELFDTHCRESQCQPLGQCMQNFQSGGPKVIGMDDKTCRLYSNFTACVSRVTSCPDVKPGPANVAAFVGEACDLMGASSVSALYSCDAFSRCVDDSFKTANPFSPKNTCRSLQGVLRCAGSTSAQCEGVTGSEDFIQHVNKLALKAASMGCGVPGINGGSCAALAACKRNLKPDSAGGPPTFAQKCSSRKSFQQCAFEAAKSCNLTVPRSAMRGKVPKLDKLSEINQKVCTAVAGQPLAACKEYHECMGASRDPETDGELLSAQNWCGLSLQMVECSGLYSDACQVNPVLKGKMDGARKELLDEGCDNIFEYQTQDDTSGAAPLTPLFCAIVLSLTAILLRHQ